MQYDLLDNPQRLVLDWTPGLFIGALSLVVWIGWSRLSRTSRSSWLSRAALRAAPGRGRVMAGSVVDVAVPRPLGMRFFPPVPGSDAKPHWNGDNWRPPAG